MSTLRTLVVTIAIAASPFAASAATLTDLYSTGVDAAGVALVGGDGTVDSHYVVSASTILGVVVGTSAKTYYNPAYAADGATSRWISYDGSPFAGSGGFSLSTTFDLTGYNPGTASISGSWGVDNDGEIFLNGVTTGIVLTGSTVANFNVLHPFTISSGFVAGVNTLTFVNFDSGPPAALRVDLAGTATAVPEPAVWGLMIAGFAMTGFAARRRVATVAA